uniref:Uncharacterized protein n=1 Tax=Anguilla anguilla TaxID=7936 RepID=A0A0E9RZ70_ANGAN
MSSIGAVSRPKSVPEALLPRPACCLSRFSRFVSPKWGNMRGCGFERCYHGYITGGSEFSCYFFHSI